MQEGLEGMPKTSSLWKTAIRTLRLNTDILAFLLVVMGLYALLAVAGLSWLERFADIFKVSCCLVVFAFALNTAKINGDPSTFFLAPSFAFIALFETAHAMVRAERFAGWEGVALYLSIAAAWFLCSAFFFITNFKRRGLRRLGLWIIEIAVTSAVALPLALGFRPGDLGEESLRHYVLANALIITVILAFSIRRLAAVFPSGRYRRRLQFAAFLSIGATLAFLLPDGVPPALVVVDEYVQSMALFMVYKAVVSQSLMRPYRSMFKDIRRERGQLEAVNAELSLALEEKMSLLREVHHRVKNNLTVIASLLFLADDEATDPAARETLRDSQERVRSVALVHELLYRSQGVSMVDLPGYLRRLAESIAASFGREAGLSLDLAPVALPLERAQPLGLAFNELMTNAMKYAGRGRTPSIGVHLRLEDDGLGGQELALEVEDDGPGLPAGFDPERTGTLGCSLLRSLASQMGGSISWSGRGGGPDGDGLRVRLAFPLKEKGEPQPA
jgi:two-component sensor histidine kinase